MVPLPDNYDVACCVCKDTKSPDENPIIFCDGDCGLAYHKECASVDTVPAGDWFCGACGK